MAYKFEIDGLYVRVTDTIYTDILVNAVRDEVRWTLTSDGLYGFAYKQALAAREDQPETLFFVGGVAFDFADIVDSGGSAFASETAFRQWLSANVGFICCETLSSSTTNSASGLYSGGEITINGGDNTKFDLAAGAAIICDYWTTPGTIYRYEFSWTAQTAVTVDNLAISTQSYIAIDKLGNITQYPSRPTNTERRDIVVLAQLGHANLTNIASVNDYTSIYDSPIETARDIIWELRLINDGVQISANGANLNINKSAGTLFGMGINWENDIRNPNKIDIASATAATFRYRTQTGGTTSPVSLIDPTSYDNGGTITSVPAGGNKTTNQRVYLFPNGNLVIQYGQQVYNSLSEAIQGLASETFLLFDNVAEGAILVGVISVTRNASALNSTSQARFIPVSKFGETIGGTAGISVTTLQQAYDNSTTPEIVTDSTRGAVSFKRGSAADTDYVVEVLDGSGVIKAWINGEGTGNFQKLQVGSAYGFPTVDGSPNQVLQTDGAGVLSWATISSGLTIGTTAIASGTAGRILYEGAGNVLQESANLTFSSGVFKVTAADALAATKPLQVRYFSDALDLFSVRGDGLVYFANDQSYINPNVPRIHLAGTAIVNGTTSLNLLATSGDLIFSPSNTERMRLTNTGLGLGASPDASTRLDVRAQGALSTDLVQRWRNSANTANILTVRGDGMVFSNGGGFVATNTAYGENALLNNSSGTLNSAFGYEALKANTTAGSNSAFGRFALTNTTGANNAAFGTNAMYRNGAGTNNAVFGANAMFNNSSGSYNSGVGSNVMYSATGSRNSAIGYNALYYLGSGGYNCAMGDYSLLDISTGSYNIGIGAASGGGITTGSYNTIIGTIGSLSSSLANNVIITDGQANRAITKDANHNVYTGAAAALATNATNGFLYIPTCAGTPTGVPTAITGKVPIIADTTNNKLYVYLGGAWTAMN